MSTKYEELDRNCREVIAEVSSIPKAFATFEVVFEVLMSRYGIDCCLQPQLIDVYQIPSLNLLKDILTKVRARPVAFFWCRCFRFIFMFYLG